MPIKDFTCEECNSVTEFIISTAEEKPDLKCGNCGSDKLVYKPGMYAHFGFNTDNPSGTMWGGNHRKFDGKDS